MIETSGEPTENRSVYRLRWIGYGLLLFSLLDTIYVLVPTAGITNNWTIQTIGALVERVVVPLLGMAFVFFGEFYDRRALEKPVLKILSWLCLGLAIIFPILILPLIGNTIQIDSQNQQQFAAFAADEVKKLDNQLNQFKPLEEQLNRSKPEDLQVLAEQLKSQGITVDAKGPEELKAKILERLQDVKTKGEAAKAQVAAKVQANQSQQRAELFKNAFKWGLGCVLSSALFVIIWKSTNWAR